MRMTACDEAVEAADFSVAIGLLIGEGKLRFLELFEELTPPRASAQRRMIS